MKMVWVAVVIILVISVSATGLYWYSARLHQHLQGNLEELERAVQAENWEEAERSSKKMQKTWNTADAAWSPVMDRRDVDRVDEAITRVRHLSDSRQKNELLLEVNVAKRLVTRLMEKESVSIKSVF